MRGRGSHAGFIFPLPPVRIRPPLPFLPDSSDGRAPGRSSNGKTADSRPANRRSNRRRPANAHAVSEMVRCEVATLVMPVRVRPACPSRSLRRRRSWLRICYRDLLRRRLPGPSSSVGRAAGLYPVMRQISGRSPVRIRPGVPRLRSSIGIRAPGFYPGGCRFESCRGRHHGRLKGIGIPACLRNRRFSVRLRGRPPIQARG